MAEPESLTGAKSVFDVLRHLVAHGPARNDAERAELTGILDKEDPDTETPDPDAPPELTAEEKAAAYDKLMAQKAAETPVTAAPETRERPSYYPPASPAAGEKPEDPA
jgi:hypothetical protein